jgi:hypothetical protein
MIALEAAPELAPLPIIASRRRASESPLVEATIQLSIDAARAYSSASRAGFIVVDGEQT